MPYLSLFEDLMSLEKPRRRETHGEAKAKSQNMAQMENDLWISELFAYMHALCGKTQIPLGWIAVIINSNTLD